MPSKKITIEIEEQTYSFFEYAYKRWVAESEVNEVVLETLDQYIANTLNELAFMQLINPDDGSSEGELLSEEDVKEIIRSQLPPSGLDYNGLISAVEENLDLDGRVKSIYIGMLQEQARKEGVKLEGDNALKFYSSVGGVIKEEKEKAEEQKAETKAKEESKPVLNKKSTAKTKGKGKK